MKKIKLLVLGLIALVLAGGLVLASCGETCPDGGTCYVKTDGTFYNCTKDCMSKQIKDPDNIYAENLSCNCDK
jgi:hypothetical protein